jgi:hypothetical protein
MRITSSKRATEVALVRCVEAFAVFAANTPANRAALEAARLRFRQAVEAEFGAMIADFQPELRQQEGQG